jgi:perosamine synthetase
MPLAIFNSDTIHNENYSPFLPYISVGLAEKKALEEVIDSNSLSGFYATGEKSNGGHFVQKFEMDWSKLFGVKHSITVNSATSGLYAAMGAIGISPGDEVIVPALTMSATAMAPLVYGGIPVFADLEEETFGLCPKSVESKITKKTKAILAVNLFGHSAKLLELKELAAKHKLYLLEDNSQSPTATESNGKYCATIGSIGVFSLNYHKHIHTGEGGMCVTDDDELALRLQLIRNHAEGGVVERKPLSLINMIGFNFRMTELQAAIGITQLKDVKRHVGRAEEIGAFLSNATKGFPGITPPMIRSGCKHVYYVWAMKFDENIVGVSRKTFVRALIQEGFPSFEGYVEPLYMLPVFQQRIAFGSGGHPFNLGSVAYEKGICPVAERIHYQTMIGFEPCRWQISQDQLLGLKDSFHKVYNNRKALAKWEKEKVNVT